MPIIRAVRHLNVSLCRWKEPGRTTFSAVEDDGERVELTSVERDSVASSALSSFELRAGVMPDFKNLAFKYGELVERPFERDGVAFSALLSFELGADVMADFENLAFKYGELVERPVERDGVAFSVLLSFELGADVMADFKNLACSWLPTRTSNDTRTSAITRRL